MCVCETWSSLISHLFFNVCVTTEVATSNPILPLTHRNTQLLCFSACSWIHLFKWMYSICGKNFFTPGWKDPEWKRTQSGQKWMKKIKKEMLMYSVDFNWSLSYPQLNLFAKYSSFEQTNRSSSEELWIMSEEQTSYCKFNSCQECCSDEWGVVVCNYNNKMQCLGHYSWFNPHDGEDLHQTLWVKFA